MEYVYIALEWDAVNDVLEIRYSSTKKYRLQWFLEREFNEKTTLAHLQCFRVRGDKVTQIDPYEVIKVDPGEV
jgi:hypothetical protein